MMHRLIVVLLLLVLLAKQQHRSNAFHFEPTKISLQKVSQSYEDTLFRKLFSSVPRREFALKEFDLELESGNDLVVLRGPSSSGKSTILRLLQGIEEPVSGVISIEPSCYSSSPIYLDQKPNDIYNDKQTVQEILLKRYAKAESASDDIVNYLCTLIDLECSKKPSELTPSEVYKYGLVDACLESTTSSASASTSTAPILLLDEWMDLEASVVVQKVEEALVALVNEAGAIVLCVTHKPHLFGTSHDCITMSQGKILTRGKTTDDTTLFQ